MKHLLPIILSGIVLIAGTPSCDFKVIPDMPDPCPDSLMFTFNIRSDTVQFNTDLVFAGNHADLKYLWSFGDGQSSTDKNPKHVYAAPQTYTVTLSVSTDFCSPIVKTAAVQIGVPSPTTDFTPKDAKIILGNPVNFQGQTSGVVSTYKWLVNGQPMGNSINFSWTPTTADTFSVCFIACGPGGCSDTTCTDLVVRPITFSKALNLDGSVNTSEKAVGLAQLSGGGYGMVAINNNDPGCYIVKTDGVGEVANNPGIALLSLNYKITASNFIRVSNDFLLTGQAQNLTSGVVEGFLMKLNGSFDNAGFKKIAGDGSAGNTFCSGAALASNNTDFLLLGNITTTDHKGMYLPTVTNNSNLPISSRDYLFLGDQAADGRYLLRAPSGTQYWAAGQHTNANGKKEAVFLNFSYSGGVISTPAVLPMGEGWDVKKILLLNNGNCLVIGYNNSLSEAQVALVDVTNMVVINTKAYSSVRFYDGLVASDGSVIYTGYSGSLSSAQASFFRFDPSSFQLSTRLIPRVSGSNADVPLVITQTSDGGFVMAGYTISASESRSLLIKTDKNGIID